MVRQNIKEFHKSITSEILSVKDRVRNLIGDAHWYSDGAYKESVLREVLRRYLPEKYNIGQGFIVYDDGTSSKQIDILITDKNYPHLFKDGDFYIVTRDAARAIIEVKTKIDKAILNSATEKLFIDIEKINQNKQLKNIWAGIFAYEKDRGFNISESNLDSLNSNKKLECIALNNQYFIKHWNEKDKYSIYKFEDNENFSFSYFIGNLIDYLSNYNADTNSKFWYPLTEDGGKEARLLFSIPDDNNNT